MCGFVGFINHDHIKDPEKVADYMSKAIIHRGPDDHGIWSDNNIFLSFRRLSIQDLSHNGHQPMESRCKRYIICFNGEIYNHLSVREDLQRVNNAIKWNGNSDTETLLYAISQYGFKEALRKCIGMFAIALFDRKNNEILLARDRFGEKPLFYGKSNKSFLFGSDLASLKRHPMFDRSISSQALKLYMNYSYVPAPFSIYDNYFKVQPGEIVKVKIRSLEISKSFYWDLTDEFLKAKKEKFANFEEGITSLEEKLSDAVKRQMISDVSLGAFLSGGIDSSLIVSIMQSHSLQPVQTFTIGFEDKSYDESTYANEVADHLGTNHTSVMLKANDALRVIPDLPKIYSEPFADSSQIPTYLVSKIAKRNVTVSLSGDAGDEMFAGYNRYFWGKNVWKYVSWMPFLMRRFVGKTLSSLPNSLLLTSEKILNIQMQEEGVHFLSDKVKKLGNRLLSVNNAEDLYKSLCTEWSDNKHLFKIKGIDNLESHLNVNFLDSLSQVENMMLQDMNTYLKEDILTKVDRASMANSLETRAPFLDHTVAKTAWRFTDEMLFENTKGKLPLRTLLEKYIPKSLFERPKSGFGIPVGSWIKSDLNDWAEDLLSSSSLDATGVLNSTEIAKIWKEHKSGSSQNTVKLWNILMFVSWLRENDK